uniref:F-box domain-containing protein n=1 Tax=Oryza punctata TaxID=4537 RepID=A0A0E0M4I8_ORYPU
MPPFSSQAMTNSGGEGEAVKEASCRSMRCRRWYRDKNKKRMSDALCQHGDISEGAQNTMPGFDFDRLPEDILCHIHSLIPLRDAARLACLSHRFLRSWRCFPNITFNQETFSLNVLEDTSYERGKKLVDIIYNILQNHSGTGVKTLKIDVRTCFKLITADHITIDFNLLLNLESLKFL